ncbi:PepSY-like domain-containing protein [Sporocytophaga myxococcoides]|uniref:PepSY-like domain-containing protein n=1 Tax=Sporocytophaga myxococcoides TaxID=153721 RepID=UPI00042532F7|nr:PepSY-like domain-containing protein [Sporocytophaga myxococcoides]
MKYQIIITAGLMSIMNLHVIGQELPENDVPDAVRNSFYELYPNMFVYEWELEKKENVYEAEFMNKGKEMEAIFRPDGTYIGTEIDIDMEDMASDVKKAFSLSEYAKWKLEDTEEFHQKEGGKLYIIEVEKKKRKVKLYYTKEGKLVQTK